MKKKKQQEVTREKRQLELAEAELKPVCSISIFLPAAIKPFHGATRVASTQPDSDLMYESQ